MNLSKLPAFIRVGALALVGLAAVAGLAANSASAGALQAETPTPTTSPSGFSRPALVLLSYSTGGTVIPGTPFTLGFRLQNAGDIKARNIIVSFSAADFIPSGSGGVIAAGAISAGADTPFSQELMPSSTLVSGSVSSLTLQVSYTDPADLPYSESFTLAIPIGSKPNPASSRPAATATPRVRPQLVITGYNADVDPLRPGSRFLLTMKVQNVGGAVARGVSVILGGGSASGGTGAGTPEAGGVSGGGGSFDNFAPLGSSNVQYLGDLSLGGSRDLTQRLIVNSSTKPGAYPLKVSFVYKDDQGANLTDDQVITLLVFSPPVVEVSFYRPVEPFFVGQPGTLPIQVVNLDRNSVVLGRLQVKAPVGQLANNVMPIGLLDAGGYFTLDAVFTPGEVGTASLEVTVEYLDDFNQPQQITRSLTVEVMEAEGPVLEGGGGGGGGAVIPEAPAPAPESFLQKLWRFVKGLLGLDSGESVSPAIEAPPTKATPAPITGPSRKG